MIEKEQTKRMFLSVQWCIRLVRLHNGYDGSIVSHQKKGHDLTKVTRTVTKTYRFKYNPESPSLVSYIFSVRFSSLFSEFGWAMVHILVRCCWAKIPMERYQTYQTICNQSIPNKGTVRWLLWPNLVKILEILFWLVIVICYMFHLFGVYEEINFGRKILKFFKPQ